MKKGIFIYLAIIVSALSMQSCVTDYVVAKPSFYNKEYKSEANINNDDKQLERNKKELINSFTSINHQNESSLTSFTTTTNKHHMTLFLWNKKLNVLVQIVFLHAVNLVVMITWAEALSSWAL